MKDQFQGVVQEYAHTRINTDIDFSFYVDRDYTILMFFEAWMNYIAGGNSNLLGEPGAYDQNIDGNYYRRFNYPKFYKNSGGIYITKFEKNYNVPKATDITYQLVNAFPKAVNAVPVQYGNSEVMRVTITMYYDRYRLMRKNKSGQTLTAQQQAELQFALAQDAIVRAQNNPNYSGPGGSVYVDSDTGRATGLRTP